MAIKLSAQSARELVAGETLKDHVVTGLQLRARSTVKTWHLYYRGKDGLQRRPKLGAFPALSLEAARDAARALLAQIARGDDPSAEWQASRQAPTVADLWAVYWEQHAMPHKTPRSREEDARNYRLHVQPKLGSMRVDAIKSADIEARLSAIADASGGTAANRVRSLLVTMFGRAADANGLAWIPHNPAAGATRRPERKRRRKAEPAELVRISAAMAALESDYPWQVAALRVMLFAGSRVTEMLTARRSEMHGNTIVLTKHKGMRTGDDRRIVLPRQALNIIAALPMHRNGYIFGPLGQHKDPRHATRHVWEQVREIAYCPDLRQQDLRRTFASVAKSRGVSLDQIGELFGHRDTKTTQRYAWLYEDAGASAVQSVADAISGNLQAPKPTD